MTIHIYPDPDALSVAFARRWIELVEQAIAARGQFHVALTGGSTPQRLYERLATAEFAERVDWQQVHIYFGDERCVPPDHPDSNYRMANEALLRHVPIPPAKIHRMQGELPDARASAQSYMEILHAQVPESANGLAQFDLLLLGLGPDGHIASLFPFTAALAERSQLATAVYVDKLQAWRISLTLPVINNAKQIQMLVAGESKAEIVRRALAQQPETPPLPVQMIQPAGVLEWYLDQAAAQQLPARDGL